MPFILDNVERLLYQEQQVNVDVPANRHDWRHFERGNPFESMTDREFRLNFRLSKESVIELTRLITPHLRVDNRSHSLTPLQMMCVTLDNLGADEFQRVTARLVQCDQGVVCRVLDKVFDAILALKPDFISFPTQREAAKSAAAIKDRFALDRFAYGIDGVHMLFREQPRQPNVDAAQFRNRKLKFSLNVMVIGDAFHRILDLDVR